MPQRAGGDRDVPMLGEIETLADAIALIDRERRSVLRTRFGEGSPGRYAFPRNLWFRGARDVEQALVPSVLREAHAELDERELVLEARRSLPDASLGDLSDPELLAVLQHHGCPTRLLDWSESLLLALWFALTEDFVRGTPSRSDEGHLIVLAPLRLNAATAVVECAAGQMLREDSPDVVARSALAFEPTWSAWRERCRSALVRGRTPHPEGLDVVLKAAGADRSAVVAPVAFVARMRTPRMHGQQGVFTLSGGGRSPPGIGTDEALPAPAALPRRDAAGDPIVGMLRVPAKRKTALLRQLVDLGIDPLRVAPGVEGAIAAAMAHARPAERRRAPTARARSRR